MPRPRFTQVSLETTPYYHCISRCVRRAFLCGEDEVTGRSYAHRRGWIEAKLLELAGIFAIDLCAYAVMSNHYHVVLHVDEKQAKQWPLREVVDRWHRLFAGNLLSQRYARGENLSKAEWRQLKQDIQTWRERLMNISWFMRVVNEGIARQSNAEDDCTGRFWEGRFKSQALLDEAALLTCMTYVDLNPIRAGMAKTPEASDYTSIQQRIRKALQATTSSQPNQQPNALYPFIGNHREALPNGLPFRLDDYLELVDWTGRILREDKKGAIPDDLPPILDRLSMDPKHWLYLARHFETPFKGLVGSVYKLKQACKRLGFKRTSGLSGCKRFFSTP